MRWADVERVLCIRLDSMGDVLMTTPALRAVKANARHVTLLTSPAGAEVARLIPEVDDVIVYEAPWMKASIAPALADDEAMIARLSAGGFDAAIIFTVFSQTPFPAAMLTRLAGMERTLAHCRERAYALVSDAIAETEPEGGIRHEVRRHLDLVAMVGWRTDDERLSLQPTAEAETVAAGIAARFEGAPWAVVHPGASAPSRRYPFFAEATRLLAEHGWRFAVTGSAEEGGLIEGIDALDLTGKLSLAELAALIGRAPLLISNNTGPAHIAAAMGTPVVDLYALTNPQHTPWMTPARVLNADVPCRWCFGSICKTGHHRCLRDVPPAAVAAAALDLVGAPARAAA